MSKKKLILDIVGKGLIANQVLSMLIRAFRELEIEQLKAYDNIKCDITIDERKHKQIVYVGEDNVIDEIEIKYKDFFDNEFKAIKTTFCRKIFIDMKSEVLL